MKLLYLPNCYSQQRQREKPVNIYPVLMAMEAEWHRRNGDEVYWNPTYGEIVDPETPASCFVTNPFKKFDKIITEPEGLSFLSLPHPDRVFTRAKEYTSGNYKYLPGTHIMSASGCWHGKCTFCVENKLGANAKGVGKMGVPVKYETLSGSGIARRDSQNEALCYPASTNYEVREVDDVISEISMCWAEDYREIFDDSATFPIGKWLEEFCAVMKVFNDPANDITYLGCNMRMVDVDYEMMKQAGFRMLLFGLESANQKTLDKINKGVKVEDIKYIIKAAKAGLDPHVAVMFGYPWETDDDAIATLRLVHFLLRKGYAKTAQASFYTTRDGGSNEAHRKYIKKIYSVAYSPEFWFNKIRDIHDTDDLKYLWRQIRSALER